MRVATLLNKLLNLPGLRVRGLRFEDDEPVIEIDRRFRRLTYAGCGTRVGAASKVRGWRHMAVQDELCRGSC